MQFILVDMITKYKEDGWVLQNLFKFFWALYSVNPKPFLNPYTHPHNFLK